MRSGGSGGPALLDITNVPFMGPVNAKKPSTHATVQAPAVTAGAVPPASTVPPPRLPAAVAPTTRTAPAGLITAEGAEHGGHEGPQAVQEYVQDIYTRLYREETTLLPRPSYMETQPYVNAEMRAILVDWLVDVHRCRRSRMSNETLYLAVNIIDRYMSKKKVSRGWLQLLGVTALLIASKYEEIEPCTAAEMAYVTNRTYGEQQVCRGEIEVLSTLGFRIAVPTPAHFLLHLQMMSNCDALQREVSLYVLELGLLHMGMLRYKPSRMASAALLLSNQLLNRQPNWAANMVQYSQHSEGALRSCAEDLRALLKAAPTAKYQAIQKKYSLDHHHAVARMTFPVPK